MDYVVRMPECMDYVEGGLHACTHARRYAGTGCSQRVVTWDPLPCAKSPCTVPVDFDVLAADSSSMSPSPPVALTAGACCFALSSGLADVWWACVVEGFKARPDTMSTRGSACSLPILYFSATRVKTACLWKALNCAVASAPAMAITKPDKCQCIINEMGLTLYCITVLLYIRIQDAFLHPRLHFEKGERCVIYTLYPFPQDATEETQSRRSYTIEHRKGAQVAE